MKQKHSQQQLLNINKHISPINNENDLVLSGTSLINNSKPNTEISLPIWELCCFPT